MAVEDGAPGPQVGRELPCGLTVASVETMWRVAAPQGQPAAASCCRVEKAALLAALCAVAASCPGGPARAVCHFLAVGVQHGACQRWGCDNGEGPVVAVGGQGLPQPVTAASACRQVPVDSLVQGRVDLRSCVPRAWAVVRFGVPVSVQGVESCSRMWAGPLRCPPWHDSVSLVTPPKVSAGISPCPLKGRCIHSGELCAAHPAKVPGTRTMIRCFPRWCPQGGK